MHLAAAVGFAFGKPRLIVCCFNCHLQVKDLLDQAKKEMQAPTS